MTRCLVSLSFLLVFGGCALDARCSMRPRSVDFYSSTGQSQYTGARQRDWYVGSSVHFDMCWEDED